MRVAKNKYSNLLKEIRQLVKQTRQNVIRNVNIELLLTYWKVGKLIVEKENSEQYDETSTGNMPLDISKELTGDLGKGFSRNQLTYIRLFFFTISDFQDAWKIWCDTVRPKGKKQKKPLGLTVSHQISWSHYYELLKCTDEMEISFYQQHAINEDWSVRELRRQIDSALFKRIALDKNKRNIMKLTAKEGLSKARET